jgi:hypothetical protein
MNPLGPSLRLVAGAALVFAAGCSSNETTAVDDHTPVSYTVLVDSVPAEAPFVLTQGQTVRVQLKFVNAANEDLDDVEGTHFGGLTFTPASLATVERVAGHTYRFDVTGETPGTGTVEVSFGHDAQADETTFPAVAVTVQPAP